MIKINLQSTKQEFEIAGKVFYAEFSDADIKRYFQYAQELHQAEQKMLNQFPNMDKEKDPNKIANALIDLFPKKSQAMINFFDKVFGQGKGNEIYKACGELTSNLNIVFEAVSTTIAEKLQNIAPEQPEKNKYVHNNHKNNKNNKR